MLVLAGTLLTIVVFVLLTPSTDENLESVALVPDLSGSGQSPTQSDRSEQEKRLPSLMTRVPAERDVSECRKELSELVGTLRSEYKKVPEGLHLAASICMELTESMQAEELWRECLKYMPKFAGPYVGLATILFERGDDEEGLRTLNESRGRFAPTEEFYNELIKALDRSGETELAMKSALEGLERYPNYGPLWYQRGLLERQLSKLENAEASLRKAYELGDRSVACVNALSAVLARLGKTVEAQNLLDSQPKAVPDAGENFQQLYEKKLKELAAYFLKEASLLASQNSDPEHAESWLLSAIGYAPTQPDVWVALSAFMRKQNRFEEALEVQQRLVELQPENVVNYVNAASVASQLKKWEVVESILRDAIARFPKVAYLRGELASACLQRGALTQGRASAIAASELEPQNVEWQLMAMAACEALGDVAGRDLHLKQAIKIAPSDPRVQSYINTPAPK